MYSSLPKVFITPIKSEYNRLVSKGGKCMQQTVTRLSIRIESRETKGSRIRTRSRFRRILSLSLSLGLDSEAKILFGDL